MSPNNGILSNCVFRLKLLNNPFASCFLVDVDCFYCVYFVHFDSNSGLPFLAFKTFGLIMCVCFLQFKQ